MSSTQPAQVRVGPAGWSYDDWKGIVYPPGMSRAEHPLTYLSGFFDTVEINTSFYRPMNPSYGKSWIQKVAVNPRFKFTVKLWERFTHHRDSWPNEDEVAAFLRGVEPLRDENMIGSLLIQFPWSFKRTRENREWLARVVDTFQDFPLALEVRHSSWNRPEVYEALRERRVAFCNIDQPLFANSLGPTDNVTARVGYVRLHGQNHADWFRDSAGRNERYNYLYSPDELKPWVEKVERIRDMAEEVYVITNNHYRGQAVVNAFEIEAGLGKTDFTLPAHLIDAYPRLKHLLKEPS